MTKGSIAVPGAVVMVNNDLSPIIQQKLVSQLHIDQVLTGEEFDASVAADPSFVQTVRALRRRIMVVRNFRETNNRTLCDVIIFVKAALASVEKNCFGPPGSTHMVKNLTWGQLCIYDTDLNRSCQKHGTTPCNCECRPCTPPPTNEYICPRDAKKPSLNPFGNIDKPIEPCMGEFTYKKSEEGYMPRGEWITITATPTSEQSDGYYPPINTTDGYISGIDFVLVKL
jgi:hypothetical protein